MSGPDGLEPAVDRFLPPELAVEVRNEWADDLANTCFVIADGGGGMSTEPHVVIDLGGRRRGRCYDVFWDSFGVAGSMPVVAEHMAGLLRWLAAGGQSDAGDLGEAYDLT